MNQVRAGQFNIQIGDALSWNVKPLLHEVRHALGKLLQRGESSTIDLRSIPLAPEEENHIITTLGQGEIHARLEALGTSEIQETRFAGVWLITHFNESGSVISRFIEITEFPDILKSQHEDISDAVTRLTEELATDNADTHAEKDP